MRKVIQQCQNNGKALELRLEEESQDKYYLILAGMTINLKSGCANGMEDMQGEDDYMVIENETYLVESVTSYRQAIAAYEEVKKRCID